MRSRLVEFGAIAVVALAGCGSPEPTGSGTNAAGSTSIGGANSGGALASGGMGVGDPGLGGAITGMGGDLGVGGIITGSGGDFGVGGAITGSGGDFGVGGAITGAGGDLGAGGTITGAGGDLGAGGTITGAGGDLGVGGNITGSGGDLGAGGTITGSGGAGVGGDPGSGGAGVGGATTECTNVRPTGTDWDEATCDDWATETEECDAAWMIDGGYCDESCGRCSGTGTGGAGTGGAGTGGAGTGGAGTGGDGTGGAGTGGSGTVDCYAEMPTSGGEDHSATWAQGGSGNLAWQIWTNGGPGTLTTYDGIAAFRASWNNSGDYLGRMGFEWGNSGQQYTAYGTITADYVWIKEGTAGNYSYLGVYGWSNNPCIEWYIVEDSFHDMPFNTGTTPSGTAQIDGALYHLVHRTTQGTGGDRCGGAGTWDQFYSIRDEGSDCGTITVSDHFDEWAARGWNLGNLLEVKIVVEAASGSGSVDFPVADVQTTQ